MTPTEVLAALGLAASLVGIYYSSTQGRREARRDAQAKDERDFKLELDKFAEQKRSNRVGEGQRQQSIGISAGNLRVSQGDLALAQERESRARAQQKGAKTPGSAQLWGAVAAAAKREGEAATELSKARMYAQMEKDADGNPIPESMRLELAKQVGPLKRAYDNARRAREEAEARAQRAPSNLPRPGGGR